MPHFHHFSICNQNQSMQITTTKAVRCGENCVVFYYAVSSCGRNTVISDECGEWCYAVVCYRWRKIGLSLVVIGLC